MRRVPLVGMRTHLATVTPALQLAKRLCPNPKERRLLDLGLNAARSLGRMVGVTGGGVSRRA